MKYSEKEIADAIYDLITTMETTVNETSTLFLLRKELDELRQKHPVINEIYEYGPDGPVGIGLGKIGGHTVG